jgi:DNA-binding PadR family transcriptional regulator
LLLASADEREDRIVQSQYAEELFGYADSSVRRALRSLNDRGLVKWLGYTATGRALYEITPAGERALLAYREQHAGKVI